MLCRSIPTYSRSPLEKRIGCYFFQRFEGFLPLYPLTGGSAGRCSHFGGYLYGIVDSVRTHQHVTLSCTRISQLLPSHPSFTYISASSLPPIIRPSLWLLSTNLGGLLVAKGRFVIKPDVALSHNKLDRSLRLQRSLARFQKKKGKVVVMRKAW
jgi:hypothetical protein